VLGRNFEDLAHEQHALEETHYEAWRDSAFEYD